LQHELPCINKFLEWHRTQELTFGDSNMTCLQINRNPSPKHKMENINTKPCVKKSCIKKPENFIKQRTPCVSKF
jgi:hypothetical protein